MSRSGWGEDPSKWVIQKSSSSRGWSVFPPHDGEAWTHPTFEEAKQVVIALIATFHITCGGLGISNTRLKKEISTWEK